MRDNPALHLPAFNPSRSVRNRKLMLAQPINGFRPVDAGVQFGNALEQMAIAIEAVKDGTVTSYERTNMHSFATILHVHAKTFQANDHMGDMLRSDRPKLLGAMAELARVAIEACYVISNNTDAALMDTCELFPMKPDLSKYVTPAAE